MNTEQKHTRGPWTTSTVNRCEVLACGTGAARIALALDEFDDNAGGPKAFSESYANAALIAAAPELLEALRYFLLARADGSRMALSMAADAAESAIRKAEGGAE